MLLYKDGNFMQLLEGPHEAVKSLLQKIEIDPRHHGIIKLWQRDQPEREFGEWSMAFKRLDSGPDATVAGHSDFLDRPFTSEQFQKSPSQALQLLLGFKKLVSSPLTPN